MASDEDGSDSGYGTTELEEEFGRCARTSPEQGSRTKMHRC